MKTLSYQLFAYSFSVYFLWQKVETKKANRIVFTKMWLPRLICFTSAKVCEQNMDRFIFDYTCSVFIDAAECQCRCMAILSR